MAGICSERLSRLRFGVLAFLFRRQVQGWGHFPPTWLVRSSFSIHFYTTTPTRSRKPTEIRRGERHTAGECSACPGFSDECRLRCHTSHRASRRRARGPTGPPRLARDEPTNTPHGACQLGEGQALSSLAHCGLRRLSHAPRSAERSVRTTPHVRCAPARRATATVARVTPCDSVACVIVSIRVRSLRNESSTAILSSPRHRRRSRPGICDQARGRPTPSVEKEAARREAPRCRATVVRHLESRATAWLLVADAHW